MNHITECIIVGTIYFLIIQCRFVPSERAVLYIETGKGCLFYLKPDNFALKMCLQNHFGCLADQQKHALKSPRQLSLLFNSLAIQRAAGSAPRRAQQPSASSWPMMKAIWELIISIIFKLFFLNSALCINTMPSKDATFYWNHPFVLYIILYFFLQFFEMNRKLLRSYFPHTSVHTQICMSTYGHIVTAGGGRHF